MGLARSFEAGLLHLHIPVYNLCPTSLPLSCTQCAVYLFLTIQAWMSYQALPPSKEF